MSWRGSVLLEESRRNLAAYKWQHLAVVCVAASILSWAATRESDAVRDSIALQYQHEQRGLSVYVAAGQGGNPISVEMCASLNDADGVKAAAAVDSSSSFIASFSHAPGEPVAVTSVGELFPEILDPDSVHGAGNAWVSTDLAQRLSLRRGEHYRIAGADLAIGGYFNADLRGQGFAAAVLVPGSFEYGTECWVEFLPGATSFAPQIVAGALDKPGTNVVVSPVLVQDQFFRSASTAFSNRASRHFWILAGTFLATVVAFTTFGRRRSLAVYRTAGATRWEVFSLTALELMPVLGVSAAISSIVVLTSDSATGRSYGLLANCRALAVGFAIVIATAGVMAAGRIAVRLRDG